MITPQTLVTTEPPAAATVINNESRPPSVEDLNKSKSNRSLHEVSKGMMLQPNANKTVNYEIYNGNPNDRFDCPQNIQLVNKKDFVKSFQYYPHKRLNISYEKKRRNSKG